MVTDMTTDRVFVLLMMVLLMMAGCFEATSTTEAQEEQDSTSGDDDSTDSSTPNSGNTATNSQQRVWYSSAGVYNNYWNDGQGIMDGGIRCIDYGPTYDSSTGEYIGEDCRETATPSEESHWNTSMCTDNGGIVMWTGYDSSMDYRYAPDCLHIFKTIDTTAGEALLFYQTSNIYLRTTCDGISSPTSYRSSYSYGSYSVSNEYNIIPNSALDCTHEIYRVISFSNNDIDERLWSVVYAIQDTIVV